ncbi:glutamine--fructose-6-phosphate transaminase (isomerizing) [Halolamina rubra]|uniref:glutamine--fructose-6-phosphate transaminase (isomerizing) n=1 Tax=Halolamina rubra TaxID=1380430 RepID=UPI0006786380|nr:glutamine--fructose-6-phosphate transaminase (isomerizing) [Halolamina rubra]
MCGITGYLGDGDSVELIAQGLKNLEYRGYDSAGVAVVDDDVNVYKQEGTIDGITLPDSEPTAYGIGHTRWSTHGPPSDRNAHPHTDCTGDIAVVHNGIISNYHELKADLDGHIFESDTDTEVIPHLIEEELADGVDLLPAVQRVLDRLEGSFAIGVGQAGSERLIGARQDSPLVVGHGEDGTFLASDVTAFIEQTKFVSYLEDGDVVDVGVDGATVYNDGEVVDREPQEIKWDAEDTSKAGHDHYMHKEIHEQPHALRQTLSGRVDETAGKVDLELDLGDELLEGIDRVHIVACGTSYHAGLYAKRLFETYSGLSVEVSRASEYRVHDGHDPENTLAVAITQSGETADTLSAIRTAKSIGTPTLAVTNTVGSTVTREVDDTVYIRAGPEIGVAATKTFVSQVATLALVAVHAGRVRGTISASKAASFLQSVNQLPSAVQEVLNSEAVIERIAEKYADSESFFFIGKAYGHPVALESALKLKEISYEHAEGFPAGELKHGPLALVTEQTPVIALLTEGTEAAETMSNVKEVQSRGAPVIGLSSDSGKSEFCEELIEVPEMGEMEPVVANVALQLLAYHVADLKGRAIDKPRNLAKSVTVE